MTVPGPWSTWKLSGVRAAGRRLGAGKRFALGAGAAGMAACVCEACGGGVRTEGGRKGCRENRSGRSHPAPSSLPSQASTWPSLVVIIRLMFFPHFPWPKPEFWRGSSFTCFGGTGILRNDFPELSLLLPSHRCCVGQTLLVAPWDPFKPLTLSPCLSSLGLSSCTCPLLNVSVCSCWVQTTE